MFKRRGSHTDARPRFGDRRRTKRQPAGWESRYRIVDEAREYTHYTGDDYEPCVLADLSTDGAGLEIPEGEVRVGDHIELDLPLGARRRATIQLRGKIRHASADDDGRPRAGIEFVDVGDLERALLVRLLRDMKHTTSRSA
jgi:hypothetical protein